MKRLFLATLFLFIVIGIVIIYSAGNGGKEITIVGKNNEYIETTRIEPVLKSDSDDEEFEKESVVSKAEKIEEIVNSNFEYYLRVPSLSFYDDFVLVNNKEIIYVEEKIIENQNNYDYFIYTYNFETQENQLLLEMKDEQWGPRYLSYSEETHSIYIENALEEITTINLTTGEIKKFKGSISPNGKYLVYRDAEKGGLWGKEIDTGDTFQWTNGEWDQQPLWLPSSEGFIYLKQTNTALGDGAGYAMKLSQFSIDTQNDAPLTIETGYWGHIDWLTAGNTIVAYNGFDDVISVAVVNLTNKKKIQLIENEGIGEVEASVNIKKKELLLSMDGKLVFYNDKGEEIVTRNWISERDGLVPSALTFSPDGSKLAYLTGVQGWGINDIVPGRKVIVSSYDGSEERTLTKDYIYISGLKWSPDSSALAVRIREDIDSNYIGLIRLNENVKE